MKHKRIILIPIIFFGLINLKTQCNKPYPIAPAYEYTFLEKIAVTPYQLNYNVGDTIQLELNVPGKKLFDTKTNSLVFKDSISFNIGINVSLLFNNPYIGDGPFASFVYNSGLSAYSTNYSGITQAFLTTGCTTANDYKETVGIVLLKKGIFAIGMYCNNIVNCYNGYATNSQVRFQLNVDDTHKSYYQQLPLLDIGKMPDSNILTELDAKLIACLLYTSPSPRDGLLSRMPSSA